MHRGHDHHHHDHGGGHGHHDHHHGPGHNHAQGSRKVVQWQTPHLPHAPEGDHEPGEADLDLVEMAFVEAFADAKDPTSFLRLAQIPFEARDAEGRRLTLLRVEMENVTDVGAVMPVIGGGSFRYDPLPARMVTRRRALRFAYFDGTAVQALTLGEVRALMP